MEGFSGADQVVLLLDNYSPDSERLLQSFTLAGKQYPAAVIEDDGFLPDGVLSVYGFFLGEHAKNGRPRYFNQIRLPDYWEISGSGSHASVHDLSRERGRIFYTEPKEKRLVKVVDWYDERGVVRSSDHYNRYGELYARTVFNAKGKKVNKSYFSADEKEVIVENYVTGDIILNEEHKIRIFHNKTEFVLHFLKAAGLDNRRIFFNSLAVPFFVSQRMPAISCSEGDMDAQRNNGREETAEAFRKGDVLFWQEPVYNEIPGNMQIILRGQSARTTAIYAQRKDSYDKLLGLGASGDMVRRLGFIYPFARENAHRPQALICTHCDRLEQIRKLVKALPEVQFHITAITEMSSKLMSVGTYENVRLYPGVKAVIQQELFETCDLYLDINYEGEIVNAIYRAFLQNQLIFAFEETVHNRKYVAPERIYPAADADRMIADIKAALESEESMAQGILRQQETALAQSQEAYKGL